MDTLSFQQGVRLAVVDKKAGGIGSLTQAARWVTTTLVAASRVKGVVIFRYLRSLYRFELGQVAEQ